MATCSSIATWKIPWKMEHGRLQSIESQRVCETHTHTHTLSFSLSLTLSPLLCSCSTKEVLKKNRKTEPI